MPRLSVWFIRAALIHTGVGFLFGSLLLHHKGIPLYDWTWKLLNPHVEIMVFGWTMQFIMGIAFWILPRFSGPQRYGRTRLGWLSFCLLNAGVVLAGVAAWFRLDSVMLVGHVLALGAVVIFVVLIWPRIKPLGGFAASQET